MTNQPRQLAVIPALLCEISEDIDAVFAGEPSEVDVVGRINEEELPALLRRQVF